MNKKALLLTFVLLAIPILTITPVQGKKTIDVYYRTPGVGPPTTVIIDEIPGDVNKFSGNGGTLIRSGTFRTSAYGDAGDNRGPLGYGIGYTETIISISHGSGELVEFPPGSGQYVRELVWGHGIYKLTLEITDGPHGAGTVWGYGRMDWELDLTGFPRYDITGNFSLKHGTDDFAGVKVNLESFFTLGNLLPPYPGIWYTKTTVISP